MTDDRFFIVSASGNFSQAFDWDGGCTNIIHIDELQPVECYRYALKLSHKGNSDCEDFYKIGYTDILKNGRVTLQELTSHGGSRTVKLIVLAATESSAEKYAREWLEEHYPQKDYDPSGIYIA